MPPAVTTLRTAGLAATAASFLVLTSGAAWAACDAYSGACTDETRVLPATVDSTTTSQTPSTLPFTGGELVLAATAGAAAVAGGAALVVAGRRRGDRAA